jgi:hypothetical protein
MITTAQTKEVVFRTPWSSLSQTESVLKQLKAKYEILRTRLGDNVELMSDLRCRFPVERCIYAFPVVVESVQSIHSQCSLQQLRNFGAAQFNAVLSLLSDDDRLSLLVRNKTDKKQPQFGWHALIEKKQTSLIVKIGSQVQPSQAKQLLAGVLSGLGIEAQISVRMRTLEFRSKNKHWRLKQPNPFTLGFKATRRMSAERGIAVFIEATAGLPGLATAEWGLIQLSGKSKARNVESRPWVRKLDSLKPPAKATQATFFWHIPKLDELHRLNDMRKKGAGMDGEVTNSLLSFADGKQNEIFLDVACGKKGYALIFSSDDESRLLLLKAELEIDLRREN